MRDVTKKPSVLDLSRLSDLRLFCAWLGYLPQPMSACAKTMDSHVKTFEINERGKKRTIYNPDYVLRAFQAKIMEKILVRFPTEPAVHGFVKGRGSITNAASHRGASVVIRVDIKDFFPSITSKRLFGLWGPAFGLNARASWLLTRLTTYRGHLCQGFVTSPMIANIIAWKIDRRVQALCSKLGLRYTRYADDIIVSGDMDTPKDGYSSGITNWLLGQLKSIIQEEGFSVNDRKTAIMRRHKVITGILVDGDTLKIPGRVRRKVRGMVDHWTIQPPERRAQIMGYLSYIGSVQPEFVVKMKQRIDDLESGRVVKKWDPKKEDAQ